MTAKQRAARAKFKAVVAEAKKLRKKNPKLTQAQAVKQAFAISYSKAGKSKVGAVKKKAAPTKKAATRVKAKKSRSTEMHTDTKSHNVNIRVISGIGNIGQKFTRITNDINGNPRYVIHFLEVLNEEERTSIPFNKKYEYAVKKANKIGGKKYDNKSYGGGIVFQSYNIEKTFEDIQKLKNATPKIRI
jgi:hypothetical protein